MDVEVLAVNCISDLVATCPHLKSFLSTNDKTPFTDGHIDLYTDSKQRNKDWLGRVSVQVKGRDRRAKKPLKSFRIARTALKAFQQDSGVLYFVVTVDPRTCKRTPYYALLSPFAIQVILDQSPAEKSEIAVNLRALNTDTDKIERLLNLALKTRQQNAQFGFDPVLLEHLDQFTIHVAEELDLRHPITLNPATSDFALEMTTTNGMTVALPGEVTLYPGSYVERRIELSVSGGDITYEGGTIRQTSENSAEIRLADGLRLTVHRKQHHQSIDISLEPAPLLADRLRSLEFLNALIDTQVIGLNGTPTPFGEIASDDVPPMREHLATLRNLSALFNALGVDTRLIAVDEISESQMKQLRTLHRAFVKGEEIPGTADKTARVLQSVGQWQLLLLQKPGTSPNQMAIVNPFNPEFRHHFRWTAQGANPSYATPVTAYDILEDTDIGLVLNMRLDSIVGAYEAIAESESTFGFANQTVLDLVAASDRSEHRRTELLTAAQALSDWLISEEGKLPHHLVNRWQIAARRAPLDETARSEIRALRRDAVRGAMEQADLVEAACTILLGDPEEIEESLARLTDDDRQYLEKWPIWHLYELSPRGSSLSHSD